MRIHELFHLGLAQAGRRRDTRYLQRRIFRSDIGIQSGTGASDRVSGNPPRGNALPGSDGRAPGIDIWK
ncbi:Uncharacterised protein [Mycobacteroides abscessus subsp. abscessus]|nr:Uncharacterised protein [Mycobacteroides abscessus subsp. abscessus]